MKLLLAASVILATAMLTASPPADATPATITFDTVSPVSLGPGGTVAVDQGFSLQAAGSPTSTNVVIDTGATPPDVGVVGDLASQQCLAGLCATDGTNAAFVFRSGGFTLTRSGGALFSASSIDAAIASNSFFRATRFMVDGLAGGSTVATATFLLLPGGYGSGPGETLPADSAAGSAESFQSLSLTGFDNIDALQFSYVGELASDPTALKDNWGFLPEFAIDNVNVNLPPPPPGPSIPEPLSVTCLLTGLAGLAIVRRRRTGRS